MPIKKKIKNKKKYEYYGFPPIAMNKKIISMKEILDSDVNSKLKMIRKEKKTLI
jgi:hypothetical protein